MDNAVENKIPVHVDLPPNRDVVYSGICLKNHHEVFIFICFNDDSKEYDGYAILRNQEIEQYRYWDREELDEIVNDNHGEFEDLLPLSEMNSFHDCLNVLTSKELVAIFTKDNDDSYYVGKIEKLTKANVTLHLVSESGDWIDNKRIKIDDITYIGFDTKYEKKLMQNLRE